MIWLFFAKVKGLLSSANTDNLSHKAYSVYYLALTEKVGDPQLAILYYLYHYFLSV